jgi:hypothetical protein
MRPGVSVNWQIRAARAARIPVIAGMITLVATASIATAIAGEVAMTGAAVPAPSQSVNTAEFEAFVREVGIDMAAVPFEVRREWASAPQVIIDDCSNPGAHAGHGHGAPQSEKEVEHTGAVGQSPDE